MNGLIGEKIGMTQCLDEKGRLVPVTVIKVEKNVIVNIKNKERDGYNAIVCGIKDLKLNKVNKPLAGFFEKNSLTPKRFLREIRIDDPSSYSIGQNIGLEIFENVNFVDVTGISKGKGFQGVMKRHNFHGGPATHGSKFQRQNGSTGQNTFPAKSFKGVKRAGRMGRERVTVQNLKIVSKSIQDSILLIKGAIPGIKNGIVLIRKAIKKA
ncbi:MAG: 50S ribosomal protein L3 [Candidatus Methanofastidiosum methylothiophilum]|uniref:50S ribosomal protein L3 n=1 Tax=Candidatus Methanofastidiosum methylothiophilum TaxID=1705564 RepID=A0A150J314_9EURY|nr:MAG: 50S ribosomal protein L3 [Candidatus Methanofastidiosum methylthiophilus]